MNISDLDNLAPSEPVDLSHIAPRRAAFPRPGFYTLQLPDEITLEDNFTETKSGNLAVEVNPTIVGETPSAGFVVRYVKASAKVYTTTDYKTKEKRQTSQMSELAASAGFRGEFPGDPRSQVGVILDLAGQKVRAQLDWRARNKRTGEDFEGVDKFPKDAEGNPLPYIEDLEDEIEDGKFMRYPARIYVRRFLSR